MECNKDEAVRAKEIADMKLEKQDYPGAKKFALKAQSLYPQLNGLSQLLATVDVYISAANKVGDELDWYAVLGINPAADDESVRKQYRKLALMLHPDKNKSPCADGAFKLICDAWSLLSDKSKRLAYNQRRSSRGFTQSTPMRTGPSVHPQANRFYNYGNRSSPAPKSYQTKTQVPPGSAPKAYQSKTRVPPTSAPKAYQTKTQVPPGSAPQASQSNTQGPPMSAPRSHQSNNQVPPTSASRQSNLRIDTFWTICHECKMHYEYPKRYLNHTLLCPNCHKAFHASEAPPPFKRSKSLRPLTKSTNPLPPPTKKKKEKSHVVYTVRYITLLMCVLALLVRVLSHLPAWRKTQKRLLLSWLMPAYTGGSSDNIRALSSSLIQ